MEGTMEYDEIITALDGMVSWNDFAASLMLQYRSKGDLSHRQWDAAERMILKTRSNAAKRESNRRAVDVSRIETLLATAKMNGLKKPAFRVGNLSLSIAPPTSKNAGAVYVKASGEYAGKIMHGTFMPVSSAPDGLGDMLAEIASDPRGKAIEHGRMTGVCACCGRTLTDKQSVALGIGPICAEKWGL
jgi:hypothetical protein